MKTRLSTSLGVCCVVAVWLTHSSAYGQQPYHWNRNTQEMGASGNVTVTAQGDPAAQNNPRTTTGTDNLLLPTTRSITRDALGGGGGEGGDAGDVMGAVQNGANGNDAHPVDGADGAGGPFAGEGGTKGQTGWAEASGTAVCNNVLNTDDQLILEYSWFHNQWGDLELKAGGGGAGGGGGAEFLQMPGATRWSGGNGGNGGRGQNAAGTVAVTQRSDVSVSATCTVDAGVVPPPTAATPCAIVVDIDWISAANPDWSIGSPWARTVALTVTAGLSGVTITGGGAGVPMAVGSDDGGNPFLKTGTDSLSADTGSFSLAAGELGTTNIIPGDVATIATPNNGVTSVLTGSLTAQGGSGAGGGARGFFGLDGMDGMDAFGSGLGPAGGFGGAGGPRRGYDLNMDFINETFAGAGGDGGDGAPGESIVEHKDGMYVGVLQIILEGL